MSKSAVTKNNNSDVVAGAARYAAVEGLVTGLKNKFENTPKKRDEAITFLRKNEAKITLLNSLLQNKWLDLQKNNFTPSAIGFQSCVKLLIQDQNVQQSLLDADNIKIIFYLSALGSDTLQNKGIKDLPIFNNNNFYTGLTTTLTLRGANVYHWLKESPKVTNSLFSYILFNVPELLQEMQINGSDNKLLNDEKVSDGKRFYSDLGRNISNFAKEEGIEIAEVEEYEKFVGEKYDHSKWAAYKKRMQDMGLVYRQYYIEDGCKEDSKNCISAALKGLDQIYSTQFAHFVLDPKHLPSVLSDNQIYGKNKTQFYQLIDVISKGEDDNSKKAGEYIFKRLKLLELETYKHCEILKLDPAMSERYQGYCRKHNSQENEINTSRRSVSEQSSINNSGSTPILGKNSFFKKNQGNQEEGGNNKEWVFSKQNDVARDTENDLIPNTRIAPILVKPALSQANNHVWFKYSKRGNNFRIGNGIYESESANNNNEIQENIEKTFIGILCQLEDEFQKKGLKKEQILQIIAAAKENGGISHKVIGKEGEEGSYKAVLGSEVVKIDGVDNRIIKSFSASFQNKCDECAIFSGRSNLDKNIGLRLTFVPESVVERYQKEDVNKEDAIRHKEEIALKVNQSRSPNQSRVM